MSHSRVLRSAPASQRRRSHPATLIVASLLAFLCVASATAQTTGDIYGTVTDESGEPLPGVAITLSGVGAPRTFVTGTEGRYRFLYLDPGRYALEAFLDGYARLEQENVVVALSRNTTIDFTLTGAFGEVIEVSGVSPVLDERLPLRGTVVPLVDLETLPVPRDPWALLTQVPGVLVDRVNVGGSESWTQPHFVAPGATLWDNDYLLDGVQTTDVVFGGASSAYFDFEQFESIEYSTGGPDVTKNTPGVGINLVTRRGTNEFRGTARFYSARQDGLGFLGQSSSSFSCSDLAETQDCDGFEAGHMNFSQSEYGFQVGGPAVTDRLWFWGSYGVNDFDGLGTRAGGEFARTFENVAVKLNGQLGSRNSCVASWSHGTADIDGRGAATDRAPETTEKTRTPTAFWRFEDTHLFGSRLYLTGAYQKVDGGFSSTPRSGCLDTSCAPQQETLWDSDGVWKQNWGNSLARRPQDVVKLDGSYFFDTRQVGHELKFGGRYREAQGFSSFIFPGRDIIHIAGENFGEAPGPVDFFALNRSAEYAPVEGEYTSLWLQDTLAMGRWTVNLGLRYDLQQGTNEPGTTGESVNPEIFPQITLDKPLDAGFEWETVTPRIGATYAVGADRDTLLRASFSQFPQELAVADVNWISPLRGNSYAYFVFIDDDGDNLFLGHEPHAFLFGDNYDVKNPTTNWNTVDRGLDSELTTELVVGVEHSPAPELVVGLAYTWREIDDVSNVRRYVRPSGSSGGGFMASAEDYLFDGLVIATLPDGTESSEPVYSLDPSLEFMGYGHRENDSRSRRYDGLALTVDKRLADRWSLRAFVNWGETEWSVPADFLAARDPTDSQGSGDNDGALYMQGAGGARRDAYLQSGWQWSLVGIYQVAPDRPWGFNLSGSAFGREGYLLPYSSAVRVSDGSFKSVSHVGGAVGRFREDDVTTVDLRAEKTFGVSGDLDLTFGLDLFNALNDATVTARNVTLNGPTARWVQGTVQPRIWRLGVRLNWK